MMKTVALERRHGRLVLAKAAVAGTPAGVLTSGELTDGLTVSAALKALWNDHSITAKKVAAAIGGENVFCQADAVSSGGADDVEGFVRRRALQVSGLSADAICLGRQPVESMIEGAVLWSVCDARQVDWMRETISLAGKTAEIITPQAFALANIYSHGYRPSSQEAALLLNIGARRLTLAVVRGWAVAYARDAPIGRDWGSDAATVRERLFATLDYHWEEIERRARPLGLGRVLVSGGAARRSDLVDALLEHTGLHVAELEPFRRISLMKGSTAKQVADEHGPSLAIAAGLAVTSCED